MTEGQSLVERLRIRANIRRNIPTRKSVEEGKPDRIADLLEEAAEEIERLKKLYENTYTFLGFDEDGTKFVYNGAVHQVTIEQEVVR